MESVGIKIKIGNNQYRVTPSELGKSCRECDLQEFCKKSVFLMDYCEKLTEQANEPINFKRIEK